VDPLFASGAIANSIIGIRSTIFSLKIIIKNYFATLTIKQHMVLTASHREKMVTLVFYFIIKNNINWSKIPRPNKNSNSMG